MSCHPELVSGSNIEIPEQVRDEVDTTHLHKGLGKDTDKKAAFTLAEGATHVGICANVSKCAFTLAEVLITLGIIGIVVAMTIPTLVSNYQKKQTLTKLKRNYSILSNVFQRAQVEHGDVSTWGLKDLRNISNSADGEKFLETFVTTYMIPYLKTVKKYSYNRPVTIGYEAFSYKGGEAILGGSARGILQLNDGTLIFVGTSNSDNQGTDENPIYYLEDLVFYVDINGFVAPNVFGKDVFVFMLNTNTGKFGFYSYNSPRDVVRGNCENSNNYFSYFCGELIFMDGWQIKDDYPIKF